MDRVLLVYEDINEVTHVEATLRKVGFDIESIPSEFNLSEKLLSFNPDVIVAHGRGNRVHTLNVGKKLKESYRYMGKIVLIFQPKALPSSSDLSKIRLDVKIIAPVSTIVLAKVLLKLTGRDQENVIDKLTRIAQTDIHFRSQESSLLSGTGKSIDSEINQLSSERVNEEIVFISEVPDSSSEAQESNSDGLATNNNSELKNSFRGESLFEDPNSMAQQEPDSNSSQSVKVIPSAEFDPLLFGAIAEGDVDPVNKQKLMDEVEQVKASLPLRVAAYSKAIQGFTEAAEIEGSPLPAPSGPLNKKAARRRQKELLKGVSQEDLDKQDSDRRDFVIALINKKLR